MSTIEVPASTKSSFLSSNSVAATLQDAYAAFHEKRESLGLPYPGLMEDVSKEVTRSVFLNLYTFTGIRADITKALSAAPMFQVSHALSMGSQALPPYTFAALYGSSKVFMQGNVDSDWSLNGRFNYRWSQSLTTKNSVQLAPGGGQSVFSFENYYTGADFGASIKAMNPSILDGALTGIFTGSFLQSVTPRLALGLEGVWQRISGDRGPDCMVSYGAKYKGDDWVASAQLLGQGTMQATYWKRIADRVEAGIDLNLQFLGLSGAGMMMMGAPSNEGSATFGAKYDFRQSSFRAQIDSKGKLGVLLEKRVAPPVQVTFAGEIDHMKGTSKLGLAVSIEAATEEMMEQQEAAADSPAPPF